jgi:Holliday junction DNA helicase RuvB subunit
MKRLLSLCDRCHSAGHEQIMILRIEEDGRVTPLDAEGKEIRRQESAAEVLAEAGEDCPLETIERLEAEVSEEPAPPPDPVSSALTVEELPAEITSGQWRKLEGRLEWSPTHHAFLLGPEPGSAPDGEASPPPPATFPSPEGAQATRPRSFDDFIGQRRAVDNLLLAARAAGARGEPLGHVLLFGPAGLGKTTIARLLAAACGSGIQEVVAGHVADPHQLISLLARLREGEFLFIDEIHGLGTACEEALYPALEDGRVDVVVRDRSRTRTIRVRLEPFTLVGATTRLGALSEPFRARFRLKERLEPYGEEELAEIVARAAGRLGSPVTFEAAREVAARSRGTPREAIQLLERARDIAQDSETAQVMDSSEADLAHVGQEHGLSPYAVTPPIVNVSLRPKSTDATYDSGKSARAGAEAAKPRLRRVHVVHAAHVREAAERAGLDERGLSREDRAVVRLLLERDAPMGLEAIASRLALELQTLRDVHEPWLERSGLVERTVHGRVATERARAWYGGLLSQAPPGPTAVADEGPDVQKSKGQGENQSQSGPNGGRRSIPILRLPFRFG